MFPLIFYFLNFFVGVELIYWGNDLRWSGKLGPLRRGVTWTNVHSLSLMLTWLIRIRFSFSLIQNGSPRNESCGNLVLTTVLGQWEQFYSFSSTLCSLVNRGKSKGRNGAQRCPGTCRVPLGVYEQTARLISALQMEPMTLSPLDFLRSSKYTLWL